MASGIKSVYASYPFIAPQKFAGKLKGKVVVVTGASAGIGRATGKAFAAAGASVAVIARREADINTLVSEIKASGGHAIAIAADVSQKDSPKRIIETVEKELGPIDILISNAGISRIGPLVEEPEDLDVWWKVYEVNVRAPVALIRAALPGMVKRGSGILMTVSSEVASMQLPVMTAYASSKAAISKFHESIVPELAGTGVLSFAVNPGMVGGTELGKGAINQDAMEHPAQQAFLNHIKSSAGNNTVGTSDLPADFMVALAVDERSKKLHGKHVNADQEFEPVLEEIDKEGGGRIEKEALYKVNIGKL
ncbi:hypothetical protein PRZ48_011082 [Zasmidium cellare]|uniref:NAD(P)-binding protein n=1 Tax=Zasmidium cellare TaxID=395010 RepID=A0ABR0EAF6_ZASCE|nr:hypothetical protein PRZ48_011082 [Zasmidium cellare]